MEFCIQLASAVLHGNKLLGVDVTSVAYSLRVRWEVYEILNTVCWIFAKVSNTDHFYYYKSHLAAPISSYLKTTKTVHLVIN